MIATFKNITGVTHTQLNNVVSTDFLRPVMGGIFVDFDNQQMVCTDAHVLMIYPVEINEVFNKEIKGVIVPVEFFDKRKYMGNFKSYILKLEYRLDDDFARVFHGEDEVFKCKYIEGNYPKYLAAIPKKEDAQPTLEVGICLKIFNKIEKAMPTGMGKQFKITLHGTRKGIVMNQMYIDGKRPIIGIVMPLVIE